MSEVKMKGIGEGSPPLHGGILTCTCGAGASVGRFRSLRMTWMKPNKSRDFYVKIMTGDKEPNGGNGNVSQ